MTTSETDLRARAEAFGRKAVERRWTKERFELERVRESAPQWSHVYMRTHYAAFFRVLERVGTVLVETSARGTRAVLGGRLDEEPKKRAPAAVLEAACQAAGEAFRRAGKGELVLRVGGAQPLRVLGAEGHEVLVSGFAEAADGLVEVELDADTGEEIGWLVPQFLRGSREGAPLGRAEAARRASREAELPESASLGRGELEDNRTARAWRLRFDLEDEESRGHVIVTAHARTGAVAGVSTLLVAQVDLGRHTARERAEAVVARALPALLGADAELAVLVAGAVVRGPRRRAGWVGTATLADGTVARVSYADEEVEVAAGGRTARARVELPALA